jgi:hypothetical protein
MSREAHKISGKSIRTRILHRLREIRGKPAAERALCPECGVAFPKRKMGRPKRYCSDKCRKRLKRRENPERPQPYKEIVDKVDKLEQEVKALWKSINTILDLAGLS